MKPYSLMRAKVASELMRPMFGPSGSRSGRCGRSARRARRAPRSRRARGQTARAEGREAPLVRHLGERVGLVHELRQLRAAEELLDRRDDGLGVDEVVRHRRVDVLVHGHLFLDGALHADEADAELVLQQLAYRAHAAVAEVVDVVDAADVPVQAQQVFDDAVEVVRGERLLVDRHVGVELDVELEAADAREVVALGVEEHAVEERAGALQRRRVARTHAAVDLDQCLLGVAGGVLGQRVGEDGAGAPTRGRTARWASSLAAPAARRDVVGHGVVGLEHHLTGLEVDDVGKEGAALELGGGRPGRSRVSPASSRPTWSFLRMMPAKIG